MSTTIEEKMKEIAERAARVDEAKGLAVFDGKITPADTYKDAFAQYSQVTPSNEIDYSNTKGEMPKVENPDIVDKIDPNIVKSPMEVVKDAKEAQAFSDYVNSLYSQSDYEADEKRKKAAQWVTAAQILGDSLAALGNVYWTGKGASPQQLSPGTGKAAAAATQLEQDIRNAREKAAKAKMDATLKKYEMEMQRKKDEQTQANWLKTFDANEAYRAQQQKNFEKTESRLAEQARLNAENEKIRIDIARQNANIQLKNALDKNKPYPMAVNGEIYEIPIKKVNEQIIGSIFAKLPEEVRMSAGQPIYGTDLGGNPIIEGYKNPSLADMLAAIGTYGNEETAKEIMKLAGVTGEKVEEVDPKEDEREKEKNESKEDFVGFYEQQNNVAPWATIKAPWQQ